MKSAGLCVLGVCALPVLMAAAITAPIPTPSPEPVYTMPPLPTPTPPRIPASGLRIVRFTAAVYGAPQYRSIEAVEKEYGPTVFACADVTNVSTRSITRFRIVFTHLAKDGETIANEVLDVPKTIAPGATLERNCRHFNAQIATDFPYNFGEPPREMFRNEPPQWNIGPDTAFWIPVFNGEPIPVVANITEVDFAQGPSWSATQP